MKTLKRAVAIAAIGAAVVFPAARADARQHQGPPPHQDHQGQAMAMQMPGYNKSAETTLTGSVESVITHQCPMMAGMTGTHLRFKSGNEVLEVHVAPSNWLTEKHYAFAAGDALEIIGARVQMMDGQVAFLARQIKKGDVTITLRNESGMPLWAGPRGRGRN